jgi:hypothetical protein
MITPAEIMTKYTVKLTQTFTDSSQNYVCALSSESRGCGIKILFYILLSFRETDLTWNAIPKWTREVFT